MAHHRQWCQGGQVISLSQSGVQPQQLQGYDQQPQFKQNASYFHGRDLDDDMMAQSCVLFPSGSDFGKCPKYSNILPTKGENG